MTPEEIQAVRGSMSKVAFAKKLGVAAYTIYRWDKGKSKPIKSLLQKLKRLQNARK